MAETMLFYIGTTKTKEIRKGSSLIGWDWGAKTSWKKFKNPPKVTKKKVTYSKTAKSKRGASKLMGAGGATHYGTYIPATAERYYKGVRIVPDPAVRYYQCGYTIIEKTAALKKDKKMSKTVYTKDKPYQYRLQYKDKPIFGAPYSTYENGIDYIYFGGYYYDEDGVQVATPGHLPHPTEFNVIYSDVNRRLDSKANNNDNRDDSGTYVLKNVRANVVTLQLTWEGLAPEEGADLLDTLNPTLDSNKLYNYLNVQYFDPATGKAQLKTFFASERSVEVMHNGYYREITVTLTEV